MSNDFGSRMQVYIVICLCIFSSLAAATTTGDVNKEARACEVYPLTQLGTSHVSPLYTINSYTTTRISFFSADRERQHDRVSVYIHLKHGGYLLIYINDDVVSIHFLNEPQLNNVTGQIEPAASTRHNSLAVGTLYHFPQLQYQRKRRRRSQMIHPPRSLLGGRTWTPDSPGTLRRVIHPALAFGDRSLFGKLPFSPTTAEPRQDNEGEQLLPGSWWNITVKLSRGHVAVMQSESASYAVEAKLNPALISLPVVAQVTSLRPLSVMFDCENDCPAFVSPLDNFYLPVEEHQSPLSVSICQKEQQDDPPPRSAPLAYTINSAATCQVDVDHVVLTHKLLNSNNTFAFAIYSVFGSRKTKMSPRLISISIEFEEQTLATRSVERESATASCLQLILSQHANNVMLTINEREKSVLALCSLEDTGAQPVTYFTPILMRGVYVTINCPLKHTRHPHGSFDEELADCDCVVAWSLVTAMLLTATLVMLLFLVLHRPASDRNCRYPWKKLLDDGSTCCQHPALAPVLHCSDIEQRTQEKQERQEQQTQHGQRQQQRAREKQQEQRQQQENHQQTQQQVLVLSKLRMAEEVSEPGSPLAIDNIPSTCSSTGSGNFFSTITVVTSTS